MRVSSGTSGKFVVGPSLIGRGVFARRRIRKDEVILRFSGQVLPFERVLEKGRESMNALQIGRRIYLDLRPPGVFVNHSCSPNAGVSQHLELVALADIGVGQEINYDYSTVMNEGSETMQCLCRSSACRGTVGDFRDLPRALQLRYLRQGIVGVFIIDELCELGQLGTAA